MKQGLREQFNIFPLKSFNFSRQSPCEPVPVSGIITLPRAEIDKHLSIRLGSSSHRECRIAAKLYNIPLEF